MPSVRFARLVALLLSVSAACSAATLHVAPDGSDSNPGTADAPLASLAGARDAVREVLRRDGLPPGGMDVVFRGGVYRLTQAVTFGPADAGTADAPIIYRAAAGETPRFVGSVPLSTASFQPVTDPSLLARLPEEARPHVRVLTLPASAPELAPLSLGGYARAILPGPNELFLNGAPLRVARYPNQGFLPITRVIDRGSRPRQNDFTERGATIEGPTRMSRWTAADAIIVSGFFGVGWADDNIPVASLDAASRRLVLAKPYLYGVSANADGKVAYLNLLEEIDEPGEYFIDRTARRVFVYPPAGFAAGDLELSVLGAPAMLHLSGASHLVFQGLTFEMSRGMAISIDGGEAIVVADCTLQNLGSLAANVGLGSAPFATHRFEGTAPLVSGQVGNIRQVVYTDPMTPRVAGTAHRFVNCDIRHTAEGGIVMGGGDRRTLTPGHNAVINCRFRALNRWVWMERPAIGLDGVGNRAEHNDIEGLPHNALFFYGNDLLIAHNRIVDANQEVNDGGVIYTGRDWTMRGNVIRGNFIASTAPAVPGKNQFGIYLDDVASGNTVEENIIVNQPVGIVVAGGRDNLVRSNVLIDCPTAIHHDGRGLTWFASSVAPGGIVRNRLLNTPYRESPWRDRYPALDSILAQNPAAPAGNRIHANVRLNSPTVIEWDNFFTFSTYREGHVESGYAPLTDRAAGDFRVRADSSVRALEDFVAPDPSTMGLDAAPILLAAHLPETVPGRTGTTLLALSSVRGPATVSWERDGVPVAGVIGPRLMLPGGSASTGTYRFVVTAEDESWRSAPIGVAFVTPTGGRLANVSARGGVGPAPLIGGFVIVGPGTVPALLRGVGPGLLPFGLPHAAESLALDLMLPQQRVPAELWTQSADASAIAARTEAVGAFALTNGSADVALLRALPAGAYTSVLSAAAPGVALVEMYDSGVAERSAHLVNLSVRGTVAPAEPLILGFVLTGAQPTPLLLRAVGPGLSAFGVTDGLTAPRMELFDATGRSLAINNGWTTGDVDALAAATTAGGAFPLSAGSTDAALLMNLEPGAYTLVVTTPSDSTGTVLAELYLLPPSP